MGMATARIGPSSSTKTIAVTLDANGVPVVPDASAIRDALADYAVQPDDETCWRSHAQMVVLLDEMGHEPDYVQPGMSVALALGNWPASCQSEPRPDRPPECQGATTAGRRD